MAGIKSYMKSGGRSLNDMNWRLFVQTRQPFLLAVTALLFSLILVIFAILPQIQQLVDVRADVDTRQVELTKLQDKVNKLLELQDFVQGNRIQQVDVALPGGKPLLELLAATQYTASASGVALSDVVTSPGKLFNATPQPVATGSSLVDATQTAGAVASNIAPQPVVPTAVGQGNRLKNGADPLVVAMKVTGSIDQINAFLAGVEKQTPFTNISSFKLDTSGFVSPTPTDSPLYQASITLTTYSYTQPISVTLDAPVPDIGPTEQVFLDSLDNFSYAKIELPSTIIGGGSQDLFGVTK
jgi:Tfp pilus assembly protein PilO